MLFHSWSFLVFYLVVFTLFNLIKKKYRVLLLLWAGAVFYGWWNPYYLILLAFSILLDYAVALRMYGTSNPAKRRNWLLLSLSGNLGTLFVFKYAGFASGSLNAVFQYLAGHAPFPLIELILPAGISFYTFQTLSYTIDVYRNRLIPEKDPVVFALYVSYFPQLIAGPIERAASLLPQLRNPAPVTASVLANALSLFALGFAKKLLLADSLAPYVNSVYANSDAHPASQLWLATFFFYLQIYGDFSGYSDMARGVSMSFGVSLQKNFNAPYVAADLKEFWKRWHISLYSWFKDYVFIPLGGSRSGFSTRLVATFLVFLLSGIWHGANATFIAWGLYHGILMAAILIAGHFFPNFTLSRFARFFFTLLAVTAGWVIFRSETISEAFDILSVLVSFEGPFYLVDGGFTRGMLVLSFLLAGFVVGVDLCQSSPSITQRYLSLSAGFRLSCGVLLLLFAFASGSVETETFLYFQF